MSIKTNAPPKLGFVILYVPDVARAVDFYERAFSVNLRFLHESGQYAEMETGVTALAFADETDTPTHEVIEPSRPARKAPSVEVAFIVDDVQAAFDKAVSAGATAIVKPVEKPWGQTVSYVRDLNGFLVELCTVVRG